MNRVYVEAALRPGALIELPGAAAQHLARVLRIRSGQEIVLFNGDGREHAATIEGVRGSRVTVAVRDSRLVDRESPLAVTLLQSIARGDRMDVIVQKTTELGVARIVPVLSERGVVRLDASQGPLKAAHWRGIAVSACEQCGRNRLPVIEHPRRLLDYLGESRGNGPRLVLEPERGASPARQQIGAAVEIAVGPEGGFAPGELEAFRIAGFVAVRLGPRVLRTETAAIAAVSWLQSRYGDLTS
ncbi:MAG TPA: 16S rRNA (uracil(1498)-N(3))-methyltransferase [Steroidobacteraceae bacterium]|nr:16S rRNA (uracil(1498)-N(3))-methyltransferase [Steroidobacteraceae bacterium]